VLQLYIHHDYYLRDDFHSFFFFNFFFSSDFLRNKIDPMPLKNFSQFLHSRYYLPLGKGLSFICKILNPFCLRMICANFGYNWLSSSGEQVENVKV
jgi:hypothetical protein